MRNIILFALLMALTHTTFAESGSTTSLADAADQADLIALVQIRDTDYFYDQDVPVNGNAFLKVLIPYKGPTRPRLIEVAEKGTPENACYFPNPSVMEEGRRYLVFLRNDPEEAGLYRGLEAGCAVDVLVGSDNEYAVRLPISQMALSDEFAPLSRHLVYSDPYAIETDESLGASQRESLLKQGLIIPYEDTMQKNNPDNAINSSADGESQKWIYHRGINLEDFRLLMKLAPVQETIR